MHSVLADNRFNCLNTENARDIIPRIFDEMEVQKKYFIGKRAYFVNLIQLCGALSVILLVVVVGVSSGRKIKSAADFETGSSSSGCGMVSGMIIGTMVGGSATIGTAQLAFHYGLSAWWYTLSCGLGCLAFSVFFAKPFRHTKATTFVGILSGEYGVAVDVCTSIVYVLSTLLSIVGQLISATAIMPFIIPGTNVFVSLILTAILMSVYVVFGGAIGAGEIGKVKTILLYIASISGAIIVLKTTGIHTLWNTLDRGRYFDLMALGTGKEMSKAIAVIMGIVTSQSYMQAIRMGRSDKVAQKSELISACMVPPIGACAILVGMFMRVHHPELEQAKSAFPQFAVMYMPDWLGGIVMGTLLLAVIGSGASMLLGTSVSITKDIIQPLFPWARREKNTVFVTRMSIIAILLVGCLLSTGILGDVILTFGNMAIGLRAAAVFFPMICALWLPDRINKKWILAAIVLGPVTVLIFTIWPVLPLDALFAGAFISCSCCVLGVLTQIFSASKRRI